MCRHQARPPLLQETLNERKFCKYGLSNLASALNALRSVSPAPCGIVEKAIAACPYERHEWVKDASTNVFSGLADNLSNAMALLHNNRRKLDDSVPQLRTACDDCASITVNALVEATVNATGQEIARSYEAFASAEDKAQGTAGEAEHTADDPGDQKPLDLFERVLLLCAACEMLAEEQVLWQALAKEGRLDAEQDVLYAFTEAFALLDWEPDQIFSAIIGDAE
jgi:hypothetical protein